MSSEPIVAASAHRHGVDETDTRHAYRNALYFTVGTNDMDMAIGPAGSGALLEVGFIRSTDGTVVIVHSMPARKKFLKGR